MKISQVGIDLIKSFEGCRLQGYKCPAGVMTIGYGYTGKINGKAITTSTRITQAQAEELLRKDLARFEAHVSSFKYNWNQNEFDALVSFAYNVGSITQLTAKGTRTKEQIAAKIPAYNKAAGKVLAGLVKRRKAEQQLFLKKAAVVNATGVENAKMIVDGKEIMVRRILKDGTNYIAIRDIAKALDLTIGAKGNVAVLNRK